MNPDLALLERLDADLDGSFGALVAGHQDRLYTIALRLLGQPADAEEVAQDAFVRAYRALAGYDSPRILELRLRPWLASITVNLARNRRRRLDQRHPPVRLEPSGAVNAAPVEADDDPGPHEHAARREALGALASALLELPPGPRAAVVLRHVDGLSVAEVAVALGRPEGTVKSQISRGLARLRARLADDPDLAPRQVRTALETRRERTA